MQADVDALIREYMPLAQSLAQQTWRTAPHALELDELRGIAYLGLVSAAKRWEAYCLENDFSPDALQYFKTFVVRRVHGAMIDAIRSADWATRSLRTRAKMLQAAGQEEGLNDRELAERTGMSVSDVRHTIRGMSLRPVSLEAEELDPIAKRDVESSVFTTSVLTTVVGTIRDLDPDQQVVLALHYFQGIQLQEVARIMGLSESRVSQLHAKAVLTVHAEMVDAAQHERESDDE